MAERTKDPASVLRAFALGYPGATEEFPWGERVMKVKGKVFVFLGKGQPFSLSVKLPQSSALALSLPFAQPTGYGLGKSGWVTARFEKHTPNLDLLRSWIDESYRAVAPVKLVKTLPSPDGAAPPEKKAAPRRRAGLRTSRSRG
jgi:predicted DNA-binding protein (MmcQ/YjbR family)